LCKMYIDIFDKTIKHINETECGKTKFL